MKKLFEAHKPGLLVGVPYTWGVGSLWYVQLDTGSVISLNSFEAISSHIADTHRKEALGFAGFRYATSMEIL